jgi:O-succinylbenzoate synthase
MPTPSNDPDRLKADVAKLKMEFVAKLKARLPRHLRDKVMVRIAFRHGLTDQILRLLMKKPRTAMELMDLVTYDPLRPEKKNANIRGTLNSLKMQGWATHDGNHVWRYVRRRKTS